MSDGWHLPQKNARLTSLRCLRIWIMTQTWFGDKNTCETVYTAGSRLYRLLGRHAVDVLYVPNPVGITSTAGTGISTDQPDQLIAKPCEKRSMFSLVEKKTRMLTWTCERRRQKVSVPFVTAERADFQNNGAFQRTLSEKWSRKEEVEDGLFSFLGSSLTQARVSVGKAKSA